MASIAIRRGWNEIARANSSSISKVPFPRRFPIIRYLTLVPLSRSYVTHQRVSVGVFLKRFMNYVDRSACGRSLYTPVARSPGKRSWTVGRMLFAGYGFDGWIYIVRVEGDTLSTLSNRHSHRVIVAGVAQRAFRIIRDSLAYLHTRTSKKPIRTDRTSSQSRPTAEQILIYAPVISLRRLYSSRNILWRVIWNFFPPTEWLLPIHRTFERAILFGSSWSDSPLLIFSSTILQLRNWNKYF